MDDGSTKQSALALLAFLLAMGFVTLVISEAFSAPSAPDVSRAIGIPELSGFACWLFMHVFALLAWVRIRERPRVLRGGAALFGALAVISLFWVTALASLVLSLLRHSE